jgi:hypothetical protein
MAITPTRLPDSTMTTARVGMQQPAYNRSGLRPGVVHLAMVPTCALISPSTRMICWPLSQAIGQ